MNIREHKYFQAGFHSLAICILEALRVISRLVHVYRNIGIIIIVIIADGH